MVRNYLASLRGLKLSRNRGHQTALPAGLLNADGDAAPGEAGRFDRDLMDSQADQYTPGMNRYLTLRA